MARPAVGKSAPSTIARICGSKPMSSMRSASSRTRYRVRDSEMRPLCMKEFRRPGVAMRMSTPRSSWRSCTNNNRSFKSSLVVRVTSYRYLLSDVCNQHDCSLARIFVPMMGTRCDDHKVVHLAKCHAACKIMHPKRAACTALDCFFLSEQM